MKFVTLIPLEFWLAILAVLWMAWEFGVGGIVAVGVLFLTLGMLR